jgi:hypothetical protein
MRNGLHDWPEKRQWNRLEMHTCNGIASQFKKRNRHTFTKIQIRNEIVSWILNPRKEGECWIHPLTWTQLWDETVFRVPRNGKVNIPLPVPALQTWTKTAFQRRKEPPAFTTHPKSRDATKLCPISQNRRRKTFTWTQTRSKTRDRGGRSCHSQRRRYAT